MRETTITMTATDQRRPWVLTKVPCVELTVHEAAAPSRPSNLVASHTNNHLAGH